MTWVKIDDRLPNNRKVADLTDKAFRVYVASICYSSANLTDGKIPAGSLSALRGTAKQAAELVAAGLWETTDRKGWIVHDYLTYNRSKVQAETISGKRAEAGSKGLANRWQSANQIASTLPLSGSGSSHPDPLRLSNPPTDFQEQQPEGQTDGKLPDAVYRQIDTAWIHSAGSTLPRVAGERFETYALKVPLAWVLDAITETGHANKKDPRYTYAILDNWIRDGREQAPTEAPNAFKASQDRLTAARAEAAARGVL